MHYIVTVTLCRSLNLTSDKLHAIGILLLNYMDWTFENLLVTACSKTSVAINACIYYQS